FDGGRGTDLTSESSQDPITQNSIFGNAGAGIDVAGTAQTPANLPLTFAPGGTSSGTLSGALYGAPNEAYVIEIYSNPSAPAPGQEQGKTFVQDVTVNTDGSGDGTFSVTEPLCYYTANATDPNGNTSAFCAAADST